MAKYDNPVSVNYSGDQYRAIQQLLEHYQGSIVSLNQSDAVRLLVNQGIARLRENDEFPLEFDDVEIADETLTL